MRVSMRGEETREKKARTERNMRRGKKAHVQPRNWGRKEERVRQKRVIVWGENEKDEICKK